MVALSTIFRCGPKIDGNVYDRVTFRLSAVLPDRVIDQIKNLVVETSPYTYDTRVRLEFKNNVRCRFWLRRLEDAAVLVKISLAATCGEKEKNQPVLDID